MGLFFASLLAIHLFIYLKIDTIQVQVRQTVTPVFNEKFVNHTSVAKVASNGQAIQVAEGVLITAALLLGLSILLAGYPIVLVLVYSFIRLPEYRVKKAVSQVDKLKFEGFMELLQREVEQLTETVNCMDSFTGSQTRLYVQRERRDVTGIIARFFVLELFSLMDWTVASRNECC